MWKIVPTLCLALAVSGCVDALERQAVTEAPAATFGPPPDDALAETRRYLLAWLKDPDSLTDLSVSEPIQVAKLRGLALGGGYWYGWETCATYRARNSFGAYDRFVATIWFDDGVATNAVEGRCG